MDNSMSKWKMVRLEELAANEKSAITKPYGSAILKEDYVDNGVPVVRGINLAQGRFHDDDFVFITPELADRMPGSRLAAGDLVFTHRGSVGQVSMIPRHPCYPRYAVSTSQVKARLDQTRALSEFYYYWFQSPQGQHSVLQCASTVGVPGIAQPVATIKSLKVPHPPLKVQKEIAATLGALDDKIESNRNLISVVLSLVDELYFSACSHDSREVGIGDVAEFHNRRRVPLSSRERAERVGPYPYYGATGVFGFVDDFLFDEVLTLVGEDGSVVNDDGTPVTQYIWGKSWINNHAHPLTGRGISTELLFTALRAVDVRPIVTGAVQAKISMGNLKALQVRIPHGNALVELESRLEPLFAVYRQRSEESRLLVVLRDTLLPELLSGRLRVREAEEALAGVGG